MRLRSTNNKNISALYFALLNNGYEYYHYDRDGEHIDQINSFRCNEAQDLFFTSVKREDCAAYPYWPRASMLEHASFYIDADNNCFGSLDYYKSAVMSAGNITDAQRDSAFWLWLNDFPASLSAVLNSAEFNSYFQWECEWVERQNDLHNAEISRLSDVIELCITDYGANVEKVLLLLNPVKCVYSADYYLVDKTFIFSSGRFSSESVVHEFLHHIVHPAVVKMKERISTRKLIYPDIDESYYLDKNEEGLLNAFEEHAVRQLTDTLLKGHKPVSIENFLLNTEETLL